MNEIFRQIRKQMQPPQAASWQTLIFLSIFSVLVASLTTQEPPQIAQRIVSSFGWIFLILGVWWFIYEKEVKSKLTVYGLFIGPWIVGALICVYLFGTIEGRPIPTETAFISWAPISTIVWAIPKFISSDKKTKSPVYANPNAAKRQDIILVLLANLMMSCWFQFYFQLGDWMSDSQYPSLRTDDFTRSAFVWRPQRFDRSAALSSGNEILTVAAAQVKDRLEGKPWSEVERWLLQLDDEMPSLRQEVRDRLPKAAENDLWNLDAQVLSDAYNLQLRAVWRGPSSRAGGYQLTRTCRVSQGRKMGPPQQFQFNAPAPPATAPARARFVGTVQCKPIEQPKPIQPRRT
jgi:drug/metabolite transporter superfamily protein YnfA